MRIIGRAGFVGTCSLRTVWVQKFSCQILVSARWWKKTNHRSVTLHKSGESEIPNTDKSDICLFNSAWITRCNIKCEWELFWIKRWGVAPEKGHYFSLGITKLICIPFLYLPHATSRSHLRCVPQLHQFTNHIIIHLNCCPPWWELWHSPKGAVSCFAYLRCAEISLCQAPVTKKKKRQRVA